MNKRILYLDPFSGVSGDMFVAALLDLGLELSVLERELAKLGLSGYRLSAKKVMRGALSAVKFDVELDEHAAAGLSAEDAISSAAALAGKPPVAHRPPVAHVHPHEHTHEHGHAHPHEHGHEHQHHHHEHEQHHEHHGRDAHDTHEHHDYGQIKALIEKSALGAKAKSDALKAFALLAKAEGKVHDIPVERVAFHEVGALDSIVDICGACIGLEILGIDEVRCGPMALGQGGFVKCAHGTLPVPVPAVLELMKGIPLRDTPIAKELTTPTGAALVAALSSAFGPQPELVIEKVGYGAGSRNGGEIPNVLRAVLFSNAAARDTSETSDTVLEIQANLDDATPETLGYLIEMLLEHGALDVFTAPIQMKKSRPATLLTVLAEPDALDKMAATIFVESSTFGLRYQTLSRLKLARRIVSVTTPFGAVRVKIGAWQGQEVSVHPEYEDCRARAKEKNAALKDVIEAARAAYRLWVMRDHEPRT